ncbi:MAG TPA: hypothetical protein ENO23_01230 [Alphaproteobacteria bacterium]|nr:hypothetical protein [Alphaproteobacteria bacterium]
MVSWGCSVRGWYRSQAPLSHFAVTRESALLLRWEASFISGRTETGSVSLDSLFDPSCTEPVLWVQSPQGLQELPEGRTSEVPILLMGPKEASSPAGPPEPRRLDLGCQAGLYALVPAGEYEVLLGLLRAEDARAIDLSLGPTNGETAILALTLPILVGYAAAGLSAGLTFFSAYCVVSFGRCFGDER